MGGFSATTILCVRKGNSVVMAGDGQVTQGSVVCKSNARKVKRIGDNIVAGYAGSAADAIVVLSLHSWLELIGRLYMIMPAESHVLPVYKGMGSGAVGGLIPLNVPMQ